MNIIFVVTDRFISLQVRKPIYLRIFIRELRGIMEELKLVSVSYLLLSTMLLIFGAFLKIRINWIYRCMVIGVAISVAVFGFCLEPGSGLDLYRLQQYAMSLDFSHGNVISSILGINNSNVSLAGTSLTGMISFNFLCYIVRLLGDLHWMSAISCIVSFGILLSIIVDYVISIEGNSKQLFLAVILTFMGLQVSYVMLGIRNAMAVSFCVLGLYLLFYKKRGGILPYILFFMAVTMHAMVLIVLPIVLISKIENQKWIRIIALFAMPIIFLLANIFSSVRIGFIQYLSARILFYTDNSFEYDRPEMIADVAVFMVIALVFWIFLRQGLISVENEQERRYYNCYILLGIAMISCMQRRDFALRIGYLMGIGGVPMLFKLLYMREESSFFGRLMAIGIAASILVCSSKVAYDMWYVFSRLTFN